MAPQSCLRRWSTWALTPMVLLGVGCSVEQPAEGESLGEVRSALTTWQTKTLPWGSGSFELGLKPGGEDFPASGPSAIAVAPSGDVLILDRWNERIVAVSQNGEVRTQAHVPSDAEHLTVGPDGSTAAWSPLKAKVWLFGRDGSPLGEMDVPRVLRDVQRLELDKTHRLYAVSAMQETWNLGSPHAPLDLAETLRNKREGAAFVSGNRGVMSVKNEGAAELWVVSQPKPDADEKARVTVKWAVPGSPSAVRIIGASANTVCTQLDHVKQPDNVGPITVERSAYCTDVESGAVLLNEPLGRSGLHSMHRDLVMDGQGGVVVFAVADEQGLHLKKMKIGAPKAEVSQ
ncbi:MAG: hypothetical protein IPK82_06145 [Polyangiaceae bacterium]|nr:hypothetical protein [Polyangiaceae bacterium]